MHVGIQLTAPEGFQILEKNTSYHFLKSDSMLGRVLLAKFEGEDRNQKVSLVVSNQKNFEEAVEGGNILAIEKQANLPPWLKELEGIDLDAVDLFRPNARKMHRTRVEERLLFIGDALKNVEEILGAENPEFELNKYARKCSPIQNETRFRLWFWTYICFGRNMWSLLSPFINSGRWNRLNKSNKKFGRKSLSRGAKHGHGCSEEMIEKIKNSYLKHSGLNIPMKRIYAISLVKEFGCIVSGTGAKMKIIMHPTGEPFPSYWQYRYHVIKAFGLSDVQTTLYGKVRYRTRMTSSKGRFSEQTSNLLERMESDGYYLKEVPRGFLEGSSLQPLCVVRSRCLTSGMLTGIGFSFGKERGDAYRMMRFSMAVPKKYFCSLFGLSIAEEDWPCQGLPPFSTTDRGPGSRKDLIENFKFQFPIREMAPSWSGQSKATIESSNPKNLKPEGQPTYIQSDMNPVALAKREIIRLIKDNSSMDMSERMTPEWDRLMIQPSPIGIWTHLDLLYRTCAQLMSIEDAVRTFLTPVKLTVCEDGIWFKQQKYDSDLLRQTGIVDKVAKGQRIEIDGYVLDMCVRHIWASVDRQIIQVDARLPILDDGEQLYLSLAELTEREEVRNKTASEFRDHQKAAEMQAMQMFQEQTGYEWDQGTRKTGSPKRNAPTARRESAEVRNRFKAGGRQ